MLFLNFSIIIIQYFYKKIKIGYQPRLLLAVIRRDGGRITGKKLFSGGWTEKAACTPTKSAVNSPSSSPFFCWNEEISGGTAAFLPITGRFSSKRRRTQQFFVITPKNCRDFTENGTISGGNGVKPLRTQAKQIILANFRKDIDVIYIYIYIIGCTVTRLTRRS